MESDRTDESARPLILRVTGDPAPKGSNRAMLIGGKARFVPGGSKPNQQKLACWKTAVTDAWGPSERSPAAYPSGPVAIGLVFLLPLRKADLDRLGGPKEHAPLAVIVKPDVDKLVRSTLDALTHAGAWGDDSQVTIVLACKLYAPPGRPSGATIILGAIEPTLAVGVGDVIEIWTSEVVNQSAAMLGARDAADLARRVAKASKRPPAKNDDWGLL